MLGASSNTFGVLCRAGRMFLGLELVRAWRSGEESLGVGQGDGERTGQEGAELGGPRVLSSLVCQPPSCEGDR